MAPTGQARKFDGRQSAILQDDQQCPDLDRVDLAGKQQRERLVCLLKG